MADRPTEVGELNAEPWRQFLAALVETDRAPGVRWTLVEAERVSHVSRATLQRIAAGNLGKVTRRVHSKLLELSRKAKVATKAGPIEVSDPALADRLYSIGRELMDLAFQVRSAASVAELGRSDVEAADRAKTAAEDRRQSDATSKRGGRPRRQQGGSA